METMMTTPLAIDMGRGMALRLTDEGDGRWMLTFGGRAPSLEAVEVQAIGRNGQCHPMKMFPGPDASSVYASGPTEKAYRVRVVVRHADHTHRRDVRLPGTADYPLTLGTHGGTLISMGHDSYIEVLPKGTDGLKITFLHEDALTDAPPIADVKAEVIGNAAETDQIRDLSVDPGDDANSLMLSGPVGDAGYLRLAVMMGDHYHTRCVPVTRP